MKDKPGVNFIITTVIGGLVFLVPLMFLVFIVGKAVSFMMVIAKPLADWLPVDTVGGVALANLLFQNQDQPGHQTTTFTFHTVLLIPNIFIADIDREKWCQPPVQPQRGNLHFTTINSAIS